jgi:hypothetical protein
VTLRASHSLIRLTFLAWRNVRPSGIPEVIFPHAIEVYLGSEPLSIVLASCFRCGVSVTTASSPCTSSLVTAFTTVLGLCVHRRGLPVDVFYLLRGELCARLESPRTVVGDYSIHTTLVVCFCQVCALLFDGRVLLRLSVFQPLQFLPEGVHHPRPARMIVLHYPSSPYRAVG